MEISVEMCATENKTKTATMAMPPSGVVGNIHFSRFEVSGFNCLSLSLSLLIVGSTIVLNKRAPRSCFSCQFYHIDRLRLHRLTVILDIANLSNLFAI